MSVGALLGQLATMPRFLAECAGRVPRQAWTLQPSPGLFSVVEHACHLRDLEEEGYTLRIRRMLREEFPVLDDFDGGAVAARRSYSAQDLAGATRDFAEARSRNLSLLGSLDRRALARTATLGEHGVITVEGLAGLMLAHDGEHRAELEALLAAVDPR